MASFNYLSVQKRVVMLSYSTNIGMESVCRIIMESGDQDETTKQANSKDVVSAETCTLCTDSNGS